MLGIAWMAFSLAPTSWAQSHRQTTSVMAKPRELTPVRMPGEFESQKAIVLSVSDWMPHHFPVLTQIAERTAGHLPLLILYNDLKQLGPVVLALAKTQLPHDHVYFCPMSLNTIWLRDFGPRIAETSDGCIALDFLYEGSRPRDDKMPATWAKESQMATRTVRWTVQGGNLIFNGRGLGVASNRIFDDNHIRFPNQVRNFDPEVERRRMVIDEFKRACNLTDFVVLEPLQNEITRHVDMFLTFIASDHAVVAAIDRRYDPINAAILDRNAARLERLKIDGKPMRVSRIQIPHRNGTQWSPYTNIILTDNLLLMSTFDSDPPALLDAAKKTYQKLLPNRKIKTVDLTSMKALQGSLHCLSMNLPEFAPWPKTIYSFDSFRKQIPESAWKKP